MALDVRCSRCGGQVGPDDGFTCRSCRTKIKTPFRLRLPSFSEVAQTPETEKRTGMAVVAVAATVLILVPLVWWLATHVWP